MIFRRRVYRNIDINAETLRWAAIILTAVFALAFATWYFSGQYLAFLPIQYLIAMIALPLVAAFALFSFARQIAVLSEESDPEDD